MAQGRAGAMPPSAATSEPQLPRLGEGTSPPCMAPLLSTSPRPLSLLCLGTIAVQGVAGRVQGSSVGTPRTDPGPLQRGPGAVSLQGPPGADTLHPSTRGTPQPPAAHQQLLSLLPPQERLNTGAGGTQCHVATGLLGVRGREGARGAETRAPRGAVFRPEPVRTLSGDEAVMGGRSH